MRIGSSSRSSSSMRGVGRKRDVVVLEHDRQIELAHAQARERDERVGLGDGHLDLGPGRGEARQRFRDDADGRSGVRADSKVGGEPSSSRSSASACASCSRITSACSTSRQPAGVSRTLRGPRSSSGIPASTSSFDELLGDRGRREAERLGGGGDGAA